MGLMVQDILTIVRRQGWTGKTYSQRRGGQESSMDRTEQQLLLMQRGCASFGEVARMVVAVAAAVRSGRELCWSPALQQLMSQREAALDQDLEPFGDLQVCVCERVCAGGDVKCLWHPVCVCVIRV